MCIRDSFAGEEMYWVSVQAAAQGGGAMYSEITKDVLKRFSKSSVRLIYLRIDSIAHGPQKLKCVPKKNLTSSSNGLSKVSCLLFQQLKGRNGYFLYSD